jgi:hypothetical protein
MSVFVKTLSDIIALFFQSLQLHALLPAFVLIGLNLTIAWPLIDGTKLVERVRELNAPISPIILVLFLGVLIAYALSALNIRVIRLFEGYVWLPGRDRFVAMNQRWITRLAGEIDRLERERQGLLKAAEHLSGRYKEKALQDIRRVEFQRNSLSMELECGFPRHQPWRVLPTELGNVIAAAEEFPSYMYGIDSVTMWPYLSPVLTEAGYASFIERERAVMDFFLNCCVVTAVFGLELLSLEILRARFDQYTIAKVAMTELIAFGFYRLAIQGALSWGYTIRTAFVLYRDKLRDILRLVPPESYNGERNQWRAVSKFFREHDTSLGRTLFDYSSWAHPAKQPAVPVKPYADPPIVPSQRSLPIEEETHA